MKTLKYIAIFSFVGLLGLTSCQDDDAEFGEMIAPSNVSFTAEIIGVTTEFPYGDGTGEVVFKATADNEIAFRYDFGDGSKMVSAPNGETTRRFSKNGINTYTVTVFASGRGGISTSSSMNIEVFSDFEDQEAADFLSGGVGNSKTWYWAADKSGNIGLGPNTVQSGGEHTWPQYFSASPWLSDKLCMYEAEFVFTQTTEGLFYEQTVGDAYVPGTYSGTMGVAGDTCHGASVIPSLTGVKEVTFSPSNSIATFDADPPYRETTMNFSDDGFMCWYVGPLSGTIEIISVTNSTLYVRIEESDDYAWYAKFQTEKPINPNP